ncbi:hypothetical protein BH11PSE11_BH11PSE11_16180 [soil metagenome]
MINFTRMFSAQIFFAGLLLVGSVQTNAASLSDTIDEFRRVMSEGKASTSVDIDNDSLLLKKDDGFYTSGMRLSYAVTVSDAKKSSTAGWRIGQEQYTASDIKLLPSQFGPPDHPYAAWLYGGVFKQTHLADGTHVKLGVDLGCLGPCAGGEWTQNTLHRIIGQPLPQGWSKQVRNEFGVVLYADVAPVRWKPTAAVDVTPVLHARFGNIYTDAGIGATMRAGQLNSFPEQDALYGYLRVDARAVAYNASLQGGYFSSANPHVVKPKRLVGEAELGIEWRSAPYAAQVALVRRGNEIDGLSNAIGAQNFARLQFSYSP